MSLILIYWSKAGFEILKACPLCWMIWGGRDTQK